MRHTTHSHGITFDRHLDLDTLQKGTDGPFEPWEGDHTALVHVLWSARYDGLIAERPSVDEPLRRALFERLFGERPQPYADGLIDDLRAILDAHDPAVTPGAPGAERLRREDLTAEQEAQSRTEGAPSDTVASMIVQSRWYAADKAASIATALRDAEQPAP